jgi:hypothetical protein
LRLRRPENKAQQLKKLLAKEQEAQIRIGILRAKLEETKEDP